jgi:hypothetical protein
MDLRLMLPKNAFRIPDKLNKKKMPVTVRIGIAGE